MEGAERVVAARAALKSCELLGVEETRKELGRGSFATVVEVNYLGLRCAGKKLHPVLVEGAGGELLVSRFEEECRVLSRISHPNIVQFLGVYFDPETDLPVMVMEFLPTTLAQCIDRHGLFPNEICNVILRDVALALNYLHGQDPTIVHRDLSANNVLLTLDMRAKVSDLGVAKVLNLTPFQMTSKAPGTACCMPPEALVANPRYTAKIDIFSYGILAIHLLCGKWPEPTREAVDPVTCAAVTEAERREEYLNCIAPDHALVQLIKQCIHNNPANRPDTPELVRQVTAAFSQFSNSFESQNQLELLKQVRIDTETKKTLQKEIDETKRALFQQQEVMEKQRASQLAKEDQMSLQMNTLSTELSQLRAELSAKEKQFGIEQRELTELQQANEASWKQKIDSKEKVLSKLQKKLDSKHSLLAEREREINRKELELCKLQEGLEEKDAELTAVNIKMASLESSLAVQRNLVASQETVIANHTTTIHSLDKQLSTLGKHLSSRVIPAHPLHSEAKLEWRECSSPPKKLGGVLATVIINGTIYISSFVDQGKSHSVMKYEPIQDSWSVLPPCPTKGFGLGHLLGKPLLVGGAISDRESAGLAMAAKDVYTYNNISQVWIKSLPAMPVGKMFPSVISQESTLIVCEGFTTETRDKLKNFKPSGCIEVYKNDENQWSLISTTSRHNPEVFHSATLLGRYYIRDTRCVYSAKISSFLQGDVDEDRLPVSPDMSCVLVGYCGSLLALAGGALRISIPLLQIPLKSVQSSKIFAFSATTNSWVHVGNLPDALAFCSAAELSTGELFVAGDVRHDKPKAWMGSFKI